MEIVLVHVGSKLPKYLLLNLKRTCELFPQFTVVLITDTQEELAIGKSNFRKSPFTMTGDYEILNKNLNHPKEFRNNFWFTSLARIYALCDYVASNNVEILHIESDVLIAREASYDSTIGFYKLERSDGAVRDTLTLLRGSFLFRGLTLRNELHNAGDRVSADRLRYVLPACLLWLTDTAGAPAEVTLCADQAGEQLRLVLDLQPTAGEPGIQDPPAYRPLRDEEIQALAHADGVALERHGDTLWLTLRHTA